MSATGLQCDDLSLHSTVGLRGKEEKEAARCTPNGGDEPWAARTAGSENGAGASQGEHGASPPSQEEGTREGSIAAGAEGASDSPGKGEPEAAVEPCGPAAEDEGGLRESGAGHPGRGFSSVSLPPDRRQPGATAADPARASLGAALNPNAGAEACSWGADGREGALAEADGMAPPSGASGWGDGRSDGRSDVSSEADADSGIGPEELRAAAAGSSGPEGVPDEASRDGADAAEVPFRAFTGPAGVSGSRGGSAEDSGVAGDDASAASGPSDGLMRAVEGRAEEEEEEDRGCADSGAPSKPTDGCGSGDTGIHGGFADFQGATAPSALGDGPNRLSGFQQGAGETRGSADNERGACAPSGRAGALEDRRRAAADRSGETPHGHELENEGVGFADFEGVSVAPAGGSGDSGEAASLPPPEQTLGPLAGDWGEEAQGEEDCFADFEGAETHPCASAGSVGQATRSQAGEDDGGFADFGAVTMDHTPRADCGSWPVEVSGGILERNGSDGFESATEAPIDGDDGFTDFLSGAEDDTAGDRAGSGPETAGPEPEAGVGLAAFSMPESDGRAPSASEDAEVSDLVGEGEPQGIAADAPAGGLNDDDDDWGDDFGGFESAISPAAAPAEDTSIAPSGGGGDGFEDFAEAPAGPRLSLDLPAETPSGCLMGLRGADLRAAVDAALRPLASVPGVVLDLEGGAAPSLCSLEDWWSACESPFARGSVLAPGGLLKAVADHAEPAALGQEFGFWHGTEAESDFLGTMGLQHPPAPVSSEGADTPRPAALPRVAVVPSPRSGAWDAATADGTPGPEAVEDPFAASGPIMSLSEYLSPANRGRGRGLADGAIPAPGGPLEDGSDFDPFGVFMAVQAAKNTRMPGTPDRNGLRRSSSEGSHPCLGASRLASEAPMAANSGDPGVASGLPVSIAVPRPRSPDEQDDWGQLFQSRAEDGLPADELSEPSCPASDCDSKSKDLATETESMEEQDGPAAAGCGQIRPLGEVQLHSDSKEAANKIMPEMSSADAPREEAS
mmetsp:Transcript_11326/g.26845  ORF Transcript_11326/g.26845 Transcript_11326/m.26845 type:complete len:1022 (-) Transcript_11326:368-3433(-)|eukprot:CAMPEP_0177608892 /NCGR_PEP_ID=MMETSP0419_2-20121207/18737_1 /TAXON_ID=582737 /ORGANISM="Tetraselmis sp., Strain GSL018" /LENGTH=1021 /DNA_ID=CAMNT_0019103659 /DNA_START=117 /DNA_END=3182 /DNA_ORIENTATION=+